MSEPITRSEMYLAALGGDVVTPPEPITRMDMYLAYLNGMTDTYPEPITRTEQYLYKLCQNGIGGGGGDNALLYSILDRSVTEFSNSELTSIGDSAFRNCKTLQRVSLPEVKTIGGNGFDGCSNLADIYFPKLEGVGGLANISVEEAYFPKAKSVGYGGFGGNAKLKRIVLDACTAFYGHCLRGDSSLNVIVVRPESVASNAGTHTLQGTPFADGGTGGVLLIPSSVVEGYKTATNWSVFYAYGHNRFLALEDYTVDGTITGEIDWDKVNALFA